jgi:trimeric autotransporter adhesin
MAIPTPLLPFLLLLAVEPLAAQVSPCQPSWQPTFGPYPGAQGGVRALAIHDVGQGPELYAALNATQINGKVLGPIVRWRAGQWETAGQGAPSGVEAMRSYDSGGGAKLYAGGEFFVTGSNPGENIAVFDGQSWTSVGAGGISGDFLEFPFVACLEVYDNGSGPRLYVGGTFSLAGGQPIRNLTSWDGTQFAAAGEPDGLVLALKAASPASGAGLFAGGIFQSIGGSTGHAAARLNAGGWTALSGVTDGNVRAFEVFDFGNGPELVAGGTLASPSVSSPAIARWDGSTWKSVGQGLPGGVESLAVYATAAGPRLYAGGTFNTLSGASANRLAVLENGTWQSLGGVSNGSVAELLAFDFGAGPELLAAGNFVTAGGLTANGLVRYDGAGFASFGNGLDEGVLALVLDAAGSPPALIAGGAFKTAEGQTLNAVGRFDGQTWSPLGSGLVGTVRALAASSDGTALYAGGTFALASPGANTNVARFDGSTWQNLGSGLSGTGGGAVRALALFDSGAGPELYAAGSFSLAGGQPAARIARWNGSAWFPVGGGVQDASVTQINALCVHVESAGPRLFAGGNFKLIGGVTANGIARWDGGAWSAVGGGLTGSTADVRALLSHGASGPGLLDVGGTFLGAPGVSSPGIVRWNGSNWSALGPGINGQVRSLALHDDGQGLRLYAGGSLLNSGGQPLSNLARFDNNLWSALPGTPLVTIDALASWAGGDSPGLYAGSGSTLVNPAGDSGLGRWACPPNNLTPVPGCSGQVATLTSSASTAPLGQTLPLNLAGGLAQTGAAGLFGGALGTDAFGCGLLLPGLGELLLSLTPAPLSLASAALSAGMADLNVLVPLQPNLAGKTITLQAVAVDLALPSAFELSRGLNVKLGP